MVTRPELKGLRLKLPGSSPVYLVDEGKRRWIPNPQVYYELFKDINGIIEDIDIPEIERGRDIPQTALLFRCFDSPKVFLLDIDGTKNIKRWIVSPEVMNRYYFNWNRIHVWNVPLGTIGIPDGPDITNPPMNPV